MEPEIFDKDLIEKVMRTYIDIDRRESVLHEYFEKLFLAAGWLPPNPKRKILQGQFNTNALGDCECHYFGKYRDCDAETCPLGVEIDELFQGVNGTSIRLIIEPIEEGDADGQDR